MSNGCRAHCSIPCVSGCVVKATKGYPGLYDLCRAPLRPLCSIPRSGNGPARRLRWQCMRWLAVGGPTPQQGSGWLDGGPRSMSESNARVLCRCRTIRSRTYGAPAPLCVECGPTATDFSVCAPRAIKLSSIYHCFGRPSRVRAPWWARAPCSRLTCARANLLLQPRTRVPRQDPCASPCSEACDWLARPPIASPLLSAASGAHRGAHTPPVH